MIFMTDFCYSQRGRGPESPAIQKENERRRQDSLKHSEPSQQKQQASKINYTDTTGLILSNRGTGAEITINRINLDNVKRSSAYGLVLGKPAIFEDRYYLEIQRGYAINYLLFMMSAGPRIEFDGIIRGQLTFSTGYFLPILFVRVLTAYKSEPQYEFGLTIKVPIYAAFAIWDGVWGK